MDYLNVNAIFPKGEKVTNDDFIGTVWFQTLVPYDALFKSLVYNVIFEPKARNNWHSHPGGQILLITGGKGYYQEKDKPAQVIKEGDVIKIPPDIKHWHGAAHDSRLIHIGITVNPQTGDTNWMEPVTDEEYDNLEV